LLLVPYTLLERRCFRSACASKDCVHRNSNRYQARSRTPCEGVAIWGGCAAARLVQCFAFVLRPGSFSLGLHPDTGPDFTAQFVYRSQRAYSASFRATLVAADHENDSFAGAGNWTRSNRHDESTRVRGHSCIRAGYSSSIRKFAISVSHRFQK